MQINQKTRGEQRLCSITYSRIAEWTGYSLHTIRTYAQRGEFDRSDLEGVLRWVNARRVRLGLPLVGQPDQDDSPEAPAPELPELPDSGYDPLTGSY